MAEVRWAAVSLAAFVVAVLLGAVGVAWPVVAGVYLVCYLAGGWEPALEGLRALRERRLDVDLLMIVAAVAAAAIGQWFDGGLLVVIFATSGALEAVMTARTRASITALLDIAPDTATVLDHPTSTQTNTQTGTDTGGGGVERVIAAVELVAGQQVLVRPGERIPGDGLVVAGVSEVDTAALTGEPVPVRRAVGDQVLAGTVNGTGVLRVRVTRDAADSVVAGIAAQVERAAETKAGRQLFIERVEARYSVLVVAVTLALLVIPLLAGAGFTETLLRAMTLMIVASPCAVVLATMPPLLAAVAVAGRRGVLVKDVTVIEALVDLDAVALDKTGTLTTGRPQVTSITTLTTGDAVAGDAVLAMAAAAETGSEHVLGQAVRQHALARGLTIPTAQDFAAIPGEGVHAQVGGSHVLVGRPQLLPDPDPAVDALVEHLEGDGATAVVVVIDNRAAAVIGLTDQPRPGAAAAVAELRRVVGGEPEILTGDAAGPATLLAERVGVRHVHAGLLPADKVTHIQQRQAQGRRVLAVGDGLNDSPLLAAADVGLVVGDTTGGGAGALTVQAADGVLTRDPLAELAPLITLARRARRVVRANLAFAATVIVALSAWDLIATLPLALGVAGHELSTVIVCLNGLRLLTGTRRADGAHPTPPGAPTDGGVPPEQDPAPSKMSVLRP
ncbi:heavy metal translocating P-type ATPase [uncultured Pseudonocardia sp.]|uniref:heavy metal translocating P-type ATPase n=1 Tax=uncultured Pseudonocardia sp. TaxID=211455 RepID=UPI00261898FD|nr:heavy metal translocating P-type ATPase [uncultured Pseudonocardia sp.]